MLQGNQGRTQTQDFRGGEVLCTIDLEFFGLVLPFTGVELSQQHVEAEWMKIDDAKWQPEDFEHWLVPGQSYDLQLNNQALSWPSCRLRAELQQFERQQRHVKVRFGFLRLDSEWSRLLSELQSSSMGEHTRSE